MNDIVTQPQKNSGQTENAISPKYIVYISAVLNILNTTTQMQNLTLFCDKLKFKCITSHLINDQLISHTGYHCVL